LSVFRRQIPIGNWVNNIAQEATHHQYDTAASKPIPRLWQG